MPKLTKQQELFEAIKMAKDNGYFVVVHGSADTPIYLLYKINKPKNIKIGKRASTYGMLALVKKTTGYK